MDRNLIDTAERLVHSGQVRLELTFDPMDVGGDERTTFGHRPIRDTWFCTVSQLQDGLRKTLDMAARRAELETVAWRSDRIETLITSFYRFLGEFKPTDTAVAWLSNVVSSPANPRRPFALGEGFFEFHDTPIDTLYAFPVYFQPVLLDLIANRKGAAVWCHKQGARLWFRRREWTSPDGQKIVLDHAFPGFREQMGAVVRGGYPLFPGKVLLDGQIVSQMDFGLFSIGVVRRLSKRCVFEAYGFSFEHGTGRLVNLIHLQPTRFATWLELRRSEVADMIERRAK